MSTSASFEITADDWIARFVALAKRMRMATLEAGSEGQRPDGPRVKLSSDERAASKELGSILAEMRSALTQAQIDGLLRHESRDVRLAASVSLGATNEELRISAMKAALLDVSTDEVLASRRRARQNPPASPSLQDLSADELYTRYVDAGEGKSLADRFLDWATNEADRQTCDDRGREMYETSVELKARGRLEMLRPLMDSQLPRLRFDAAVACLSLDRAKAIATLEDVAKTGNIVERGDAELNLRLLKAKAGIP